ncbi:hypothetical protein [Pseudomonas sp. MYb118]|uniref:hypothetical protein n=1 Tax=Pseudomonas sp. MYb118 TaxID=1848720 RepID=UPI0034CF02D1
MPAKDIEGDHVVTFMLNFGGNVGDALSVTYTVQKDAQNFDDPAELPPFVAQRGLAADDFASGPVPISFDYPNMKLGDTVECHMGRDPDNTQVIGSITVDENQLGKPLIFDLKATHISTYSGKYVIFCKGHTYPNVVATPSPTVEVFVFDKPRPGVTVPLNVPQAPDPGDVLLAHHFASVGGIKVGLDLPYSNADFQEDWFHLFIDGVALPRRKIVEIPFLTNPDLNLLVTQGNEGTIKFEYQIERHGFFFPAAKIEKEVDYDLRMPFGDFNLTDPTSADKTSLAPEVWGPVSNTKNKLTAADKQSDLAVRFLVPLHPNFNQGDVIQGYYAGRAIPGPGGRYAYPADGSTPPDPVELTMLWLFLGDIPDNKDTQISYRATHAVNTNVSQSLTGLADVNTTPITLGVPTFQFLDPTFNFFVCSSLRKRADGKVVGVIAIPADTRLANVKVEFTYAGYGDDSGDDSTLIPDTQFDGDFTPNAQQAAQTMYAYVEFDPYLINTYNAWGIFRYRVTIAGELAAAVSPVTRINMSVGSDVCDITVPIPPHP